MRVHLQVFHTPSVSAWAGSSYLVLCVHPGHHNVWKQRYEECTSERISAHQQGGGYHYHDLHAHLLPRFHYVLLAVERLRLRIPITMRREAVWVSAGSLRLRLSKRPQLRTTRLHFHDILEPFLRVHYKCHHHRSHFRYRYRHFQWHEGTRRIPRKRQHEPMLHLLWRERQVQQAKLELREASGAGAQYW